MFKEFNLQQLCSKSRITLVAQKLRSSKVGEWQRGIPRRRSQHGVSNLSTGITQSRSKIVLFEYFLYFISCTPKIQREKSKNFYKPLLRMG